MAIRVPPGGFAGFNQMTPASRLALREAVGNGSNGTRRRRRKAKASGKTSRKRKRRGARRAKGRKLKFGSPAWRKKYMKKR